MSFLNNGVNNVINRYGGYIVQTGTASDVASSNLVISASAISYNYFGVVVDRGNDGTLNVNGGNGGDVRIVSGSGSGTYINYNVSSRVVTINATTNYVLQTFPGGAGGVFNTGANGPVLPPPFDQLSVSGGGAGRVMDGYFTTQGNGAIGRNGGTSADWLYPTYNHGTYGGGGGTTASSNLGGNWVIILFIMPTSIASLGEYKINTSYLLEDYYDTKYPKWRDTSTGPVFSTTVYNSIQNLYTGQILQTYPNLQFPTTIDFTVASIPTPFTITSDNDVSNVMVHFLDGIYTIRCETVNTINIVFNIARSRTYNIICCGKGGDSTTGTSPGGAGGAIRSMFTTSLSSISINCTNANSSAIITYTNGSYTLTANAGPNNSSSYGTTSIAQTGTAIANILNEQYYGQNTRLDNNSANDFLQYVEPKRYDGTNFINRAEFTQRTFSTGKQGFGGSGLSGNSFWGNGGGGLHGASGISYTTRQPTGYGAGAGGPYPGTANVFGAKGVVFVVFSIAE